ncbi:MAG: hypothetical protein HDR08_11105 [Lachnospiraceae bacterium]|nr:hypothetical protein [Lachnospiraceae bacterium]
MRKTCFVVMPIGEYGSSTYKHYLEVYEDLFMPAIKKAGYIPKRADEEKSCNVIQCDIVQKIIDSDMVLCDLSGKNPNVLYELGIRQAFDLPVVLVQEQGTDRIFDISIIRTIDYDHNMNNRRLKLDIDAISDAIERTSNETSGINSIIKFINIEKKLREKDTSDKEAIDILLNALLNKIQDIEDGQDGIYELLSQNQHNVQFMSDNINNKWRFFWERYQVLNNQLTKIVCEYSNTFNYDLLGEAYELRNEFSVLPQIYFEELVRRLGSFRKIAEYIITLK